MEGEIKRSELWHVIPQRGLPEDLHADKADKVLDP
jgi:hypothetical protein